MDADEEFVNKTMIIIIIHDDNVVYMNYVNRRRCKTCFKDTTHNTMDNTGFELYEGKMSETKKVE